MKNGKNTKYGAVYHDIMGKIKSGELKVGDKLPCETELVKIYGVSRITVSRALSDLAETNLIYRVKKAGTFVNGKLNQKNMQLIIPVILPFYEEFDEISKGIESVSLSGNIFTPYYNSKNNVMRERNYLTQIINGNNLDGLIAYPCSSRENIDLYAEILARKIPIVCLDRNIQGLDTPLVTTTNAKCMERIVSRLAAMGHKNIGFFSLSDRMAITETERFKGFCSGLIKNGLKPKREYLFENTDINRREIKLSQPRQKRLLNEFANKCLDKYAEMQEKPTAICCINDRGMKGIYECACERGIKVPRELTLTGFDCIDESEIKSHGFISVRQNFYGLGKAAIELMLKILDGQPYPAAEFVDGIIVTPE